MKKFVVLFFMFISVLTFSNSVERLDLKNWIVEKYIDEDENSVVIHAFNKENYDSFFVHKNVLTESITKKVHIKNDVYAMKVYKEGVTEVKNFSNNFEVTLKFNSDKQYGSHFANIGMNTSYPPLMQIDYGSYIILNNQANEIIFIIDNNIRNMCNDMGKTEYFIYDLLNK